MLKQELLPFFGNVIYPLIVGSCVYILPAFKLTQLFKKVYSPYSLLYLTLSILYAEQKVIAFILLSLDLQDKLLTSLPVVPAQV